MRKKENLQEKIDMLDRAIWETANMLTNICKQDLEPWEYEAAIRCATGHLMFISESIIDYGK
jgi:hypothetical protein